MVKATTKISTSIIGVNSELKAIIHYQNLGYIVAKTIDPLSPFDLTITDPVTGVTKKIDVKTDNSRKTKCCHNKPGDRIYRALSIRQKKLGVILFYQR